MADPISDSEAELDILAPIIKPDFNIGGEIIFEIDDDVEH